jgi:ABC-type uncharacterized transport system permease subunit
MTPSPDAAVPRRRLPASVIATGLVSLVAVGLLAVAGANPIEALGVLAAGSFGTAAKISDTLMVWAPLALAACSLLVTFRAGLWNIGVEGQIIAGAVGATWVARTMPGPGALVVAAALVSAAIAGAMWALLVGVLKVKGGVNEIFGGLGLDFVATGMVLYLILGPWSRAGIASTSGTEPFREEVWLTTLPSTRLAPVAMAIVALAAVAVYVLLQRTMMGLRITAAGRSPGAAARLGVAVDRHVLWAFAIGGGLAGLGGWVQALGFHHKLVPSISGGYGFLAILVVLLAVQRVGPSMLIALGFAALSVGAIQLQLRLDLDSSVAGVLQGVSVLVAVLTLGVRGRDSFLPSAHDTTGES